MYVYMYDFVDELSQEDNCNKHFLIAYCLNATTITTHGNAVYVDTL